MTAKGVRKNMPKVIYAVFCRVLSVPADLLFCFPKEIHVNKICEQLRSIFVIWVTGVATDVPITAGIYEMGGKQIATGKVHSCLMPGNTAQLIFPINQQNISSCIWNIGEELDIKIFYE